MVLVAEIVDALLMLKLDILKFPPKMMFELTGLRLLVCSVPTLLIEKLDIFRFPPMVVLVAGEIGAMLLVLMLPMIAFEPKLTGLLMLMLEVVI